jgi:hypothetical protein
MRRVMPPWAVKAIVDRLYPLRTVSSFPCRK